MAAPPASLVALDRARLVLGTSVLLDDVSVGVADGDRIGVVGRNGGGKTTLLGVLTGSRELDDGRVLRTGDVTTGMLGQTDTLPPEATVREVVLGDLAEHVWAGDARVREVLEGLLGGTGATAVGGWDAVVGPMSGGERRRLALAALLVADPDLLVLDEPVSALDVTVQAAVLDLLADLQERTGTSLVLISHDLAVVRQVCELVAVMQDGRVVERGPVEEVWANPKAPFTRALLAASAPLP